MRIFLTLLLSLAIALPGLPLRAAPTCAMGAKSTHAMQMSKNCKHCRVQSKQEQTKKHCCNDKACAAQCSVVGSVAGAILASITMPTFRMAAPDFAVKDSVALFYFLQTQERPPKYFS